MSRAWTSASSSRPAAPAASPRSSATPPRRRASPWRTGRPRALGSRRRSRRAASRHARARLRRRPRGRASRWRARSTSVVSLAVQRVGLLEHSARAFDIALSEALTRPRRVPAREPPVRTRPRPAGDAPSSGGPRRDARRTTRTSRSPTRSPEPPPPPRDRDASRAPRARCRGRRPGATATRVGAIPARVPRRGERAEVGGVAVTGRLPVVALPQPLGRELADHLQQASRVSSRRTSVRTRLASTSAANASATSQDDIASPVTASAAVRSKPPENTARRADRRGDQLRIGERCEAHEARPLVEALGQPRRPRSRARSCPRRRGP